jgi:hypothetical protein
MAMDPITDCLVDMRGCDWDRSDLFKDKTLLEHPAVEQRAKKPKGEAERARALKILLEEAMVRLEAQEIEREVERDRSFVYVGRAILGLSDEFANMGLREIREEIIKEWCGPRGKRVKLTTLRQHNETKEVLPRVARELEAVLGEVKISGVTKVPSSSLPPGVSLSAKEKRMVQHLEKMEDKTYKARRRGLYEEGKLKIRDKDEMLAILRKVNRLAKHSLKAVDQTPIGHWMDEDTPLGKYLNEQLEQVKKKKLHLERIYVLSQKAQKNLLKDKEALKLFAEFVKRHEKASATLWLCPETARSDFFQEDRGLILADGGKEPLAVTGVLREGKVGTAFVYTRYQEDVQQLNDEFINLRLRTRSDGHDQRLRKKLGLV